MARVKSDLEDEMRRFEEKAIQEEDGWASDSSSDSDTDSEMSDDEGEFTAFLGGRVGMGTGNEVGKTFAFEINTQRRGSVGFARLQASVSGVAPKAEVSTSAAAVTSAAAEEGESAAASQSQSQQEYDDDSSEDEFWGQSEEKVEQQGADEQKKQKEQNETAREERSQTFLDKAAEFLGLSSSAAAPTEGKQALPPPPPPALGKAPPGASQPASTALTALTPSAGLIRENSTGLEDSEEFVSTAARVAVPQQRYVACLMLFRFSFVLFAFSPLLPLLFPRSRGRARVPRREKLTVLRDNESGSTEPPKKRNYSNWLSERIDALRANERSTGRGSSRTVTSARRRSSKAKDGAETSATSTNTKKKRKKKKTAKKKRKKAPTATATSRGQQAERQDFFTSNYGAFGHLGSHPLVNPDN